MSEKNILIGATYYEAMKNKDIEKMSSYLHPNVHFKGPLASLEGKESVVEGLKKFTTLFKNLTPRATFGSDTQAFIVFDLDFGTPAGLCSVASLMTIQEGLIVKTELFLDPRPLIDKIFSQDTSK